MYKNQLQELAQRSCVDLPSYSCVREGPDHGPRFKATVTFNGEGFESPAFYSTLRQAEHSAAHLALATLAIRDPSRALTARVLDETGVYKNLLQETAHRAGLRLPVYTTVRSGPGQVHLFSCTVELAGMSFAGEPARTKKQAQKNAAMSAWSSLKTLAHGDSPSYPSMESRGDEEQEQVTIARVLGNLRQNNHHYHNRQRDVSNSTISLYSSTSHFQNRAYPTYHPPEISMYHLWHQEQFLHRRIFQIPVFPSRPPLFPFVQSVIRPDSFLYFPIADQASAPAGPPMGGRSTVTIREIQEEKAQEEAPSPRASGSSSEFPAESRARARTWSYHHPRPNSAEVRSAGPAFGTRMRTGISPARPSFMAPAVRIRSVVPVCSAPPPRRTEMAETATEKKNDEDVPRASSELDKLRI